MKDQSRVIAALLIGAAAGAALGLLLAPNTGEGLRSDIADYVNDLVSSAKEKAQATAGNVKEYGSNAIDKVKSRFNGEYDNLADKANNFSDEVRSGANDHIDAVKSKVKSRVNDAVQHA